VESICGANKHLIPKGGTMCPVCVATTATILAGSTAGGGGIAALIVGTFKGWFRRGK
jgi:hypothetical protein